MWATLSPEQRKILGLYYRDNCFLGEVAEKIKKTKKETNEERKKADALIKEGLRQRGCS